MINPFQLMSNPQNFLTQQLQNRMNQMAQQNPQVYRKMQEMTSGKSEADMKQTAINLAKERGIDLKSFASGFGIQL